MKNYSIEKIGADYVVKVDDQSVMKMASRRRAAQLVVDASGLLEEVPLVPDAGSPLEVSAGEADALCSQPEGQGVAPVDGAA
ncbi:hypothetical protein RPMA_21755 [Tardiphaga alba]|uniref:Uncharacterized protein n=1 Tax=Tardiphaga alba TaxID=340268 RepID=A0ABX8ABX9_9BRAD|nr:hypothetical protein [Tardiphaga alba]QUS41173.1 hypothetical protein RPMA_21755 [Tardiphaga alba]